MSISFKAITLMCRDADRTGKFYQEVFGAKIIPNDIGLSHSVAIGDLTIALLQNCTNACPAKFPEDAMYCLWLQTESLCAFVGNLRKLEVTIHEYCEDQFVLLSDPDGLMIEVWDKKA